MDKSIGEVLLRLIDSDKDSFTILWDEHGDIRWANHAAHSLLKLDLSNGSKNIAAYASHPLIVAGLGSEPKQTAEFNIRKVACDGDTLLIATPAAASALSPQDLVDNLDTLYSRIIDSCSDKEMIAIVGQDLRYKAVSEKYANLHSRTVEELQGLLVEDVLEPGLASKVISRVHRTLEGETHRYKDCLHNQIGRSRSFDAQYRPFWYYGDQISATIITLRDITLEQQSAKAIRESESRYRELINTMRSGVAVYEAIDNGEDFVFRDLNPAGCDLGNLKKQDVVGRSVREVYPKVQEMGLFDAFQRVYRTGKTEQLPLTLYQDARITQWVDNIIYRLPDGDVVAIYEDVTDRMITLESLNIRDRALASATNAILISEARDDQPIVYMNAAFEKMTGYSAAEVLGKNARFLQSLDRNQPEVAIMHDAVRNAEPCEVKLRNYGKSGQSFIAKVSLSPVRNKAGELTHFVGIQEDITESVKLQKELMQAQKMEALGQLSGGIAHDFNNILASMMGFADLALRLSGKNQPQKIKGYLENVLEGGRRAQGLIAQMMVFTRPQINSNEVHDLGPEIIEITNLLSSTLPSSITINVHIEDDLPKAKLQAIHFHQVLMNLAVNARDAMDGRGQLGITLHMKEFTHEECTVCHEDLRGRWLVLSVSDTGTGIKPEMLSNIFEPFFTTKETSQGTGLGLSVTHRIVSAQGGHVLVESEFGEGSTFHVLIPSESQADSMEEDSLPASTVEAGQEEHILVVDDEPALTKYLTELLLTSGYKATAVNSPKEAEALLREKPQDYFDLLIADQTMPEITGTELIASVRESAPDLPVILCTGNSQEVKTRDIKDGGIDLLLNKPIYGDFLLAQIQELLKKHKHGLRGL